MSNEAQATIVTNDSQGAETMAIVFEMWAECATAEDCRVLVGHFDGLRMTLLTGRTVTWKSEVVPSSAAAMRGWSPDLTSGGLNGVLERTESGLRLYHHLKEGPAFRFARVAWEAGCVPMADLPHYVDASYKPGKCRLEVECVVDEALYRQLGSPEFCFPFREGYWWTRYGGESYAPLNSPDQSALNELLRSLFPEYIKYW